MQNWLVGLAHAGGAGRLVLVCTDTRRTYELAVTGFKHGQGWGAAWNLRPNIDAANRIYFSANNGEGVFELLLSSIDLTKTGTDEPGARLQHSGLASAVTPNNDGLYCNPLIDAQDDSINVSNGSTSSNNSQGVPFWIFYLLLGIFGALLCCAMALAFFCWKRDKKEMHEFELAESTDHIDEVSVLHHKVHGDL